MGPACGLQALITALAYRWAAAGRITHAHIPDDPTIESERRQIFFGAAVDLPTFFVHKDSRNRFLMRILAGTDRTRSSNRYSGYIRVYHQEYRKALLGLIRQEGADLIESMGLSEVMRDLEHRILHPEMHGVATAITHGVLQAKNALDPLEVDADDFNREAERYYRTTVRRRHVQEGLEVLAEELQEAEAEPRVQPLLKAVLGEQDVPVFMARVRADFESLGENDLQRLIHIILVTVLKDWDKGHAAPVR